MLGDYGYVVVIEYNITTTTPSTVRTTAVTEEESTESTSSSDSDSHDDHVKTFWALYGHLDRKGIKKLQKKQRIGQQRVSKGECIGYVGDIDDNGGWIAPHVHFQLSIVEPIAQHDMPGAASVRDRNRALIQYPDPRYLLGPLY